MTNPRDPRLRRGAAFPTPGDPLAAAVRLELAADAMRAQQLERGAEPDAGWVADHVPLPEHFAAVGAAAADITANLAAAPLTAAEFAAALGDDDEPEPVAESPAPPPAPVPPAPTAVAVTGELLPELPASSYPPEAVEVSPAFSSERRPVLNWRSRHDPESLNYGVRSRLAGSAPVTDHLWLIGPVLDQGTEGACVGFGVIDAVNAINAADVDRGADSARELYHRAQQLDEVPGEAYDGTSVLAGMQAAVEEGLIGGYLWAFGTRDVAQAILQRGPVVVGVPWLSGMYETGPGGLVTLEGDDTGAGHCLAVVGIRRKGPQGQPGPYFVWQNSWGPSYGDGGLGYIHHRDLAQLLHGAGEAAIPTREAQHVRV